MAFLYFFGDFLMTRLHVGGWISTNIWMFHRFVSLLLNLEIGDNLTLMKKANKSVRKQSANKKRTSAIAQQRQSKGTSETLNEQTKYLQLMERIAVAANKASVVSEAMQICLYEVPWRVSAVMSLL